MRGYSRKAGSPEERVKAFIAHYQEQWSKAQKKMGSRVDFKYWQSLIAPVDDTHFVSGRSSGQGSSFSSSAPYDPESTIVTDCETRGERARVFAEHETTSVRPRYYVFYLEHGDDENWLISNMLELLYPPNSLFIDPDRNTGVLAMSSPTAPLTEIQDKLKLDENVLFQGDRTVDVPQLGAKHAKLQDVGTLKVQSGVLGMFDFGYNMYEFEPLHRGIEPGEYPVQVLWIENRVVGLRVRFNEDRAAMKWYAAKTPEGTGIYGVDAGNLAIMDVGGLLELTHLEKEILYETWIRTCQPALLSMKTDNDCVITPSGFGDGAYPAFWGVDASDEVVSLFIDFMVLVEEDDEGFMVSI